MKRSISLVLSRLNLKLLSYGYLTDKGKMLSRNLEWIVNFTENIILKVTHFKTILENRSYLCS